MYIFGYGSLINDHSRSRTGQTGRAIPAMVNGLQRHWSKVDGSYKISPLIVVPEAGQCNGVIVEVDRSALAEFDKREHGYHRIRIDSQDVALQNSDQPLSGGVWVYVKDEPLAPCAIQPIMQTYVDTVLAGCLSISDAFAEYFVSSTQGWHHAFENDRHQPKYGNMAGIVDSHLPIIDQLIRSVRQ
ncbi:gamma-glutamylcyclotransferase family protein [Photobacterium swingsii]|uniref:gamma-glutamylcyclotransferase family protein n=1 Tax=Photobacterium swingsii TaxID=680026 RepID=UPI004068E140